MQILQLVPRGYFLGIDTKTVKQQFRFAISSFVSSAEVPSCQDRDMLKARMRADLKVYHKAILDLQQSVGEQFRMSRQRLERARLAYEAASQTLHSHLTSHCCE